VRCVHHRQTVTTCNSSAYQKMETCKNATASQSRNPTVFGEFLTQRNPPPVLLKPERLHSCRACAPQSPPVSQGSRPASGHGCQPENGPGVWRGRQRLTAWLLNNHTWALCWSGSNNTVMDRRIHGPNRCPVMCSSTRAWRQYLCSQSPGRLPVTSRRAKPAMLTTPRGHVSQHSARI
jgi:hypothetical protein